MQRVSIGIPAYNQGQYLRETLASLVAQADDTTEIVVSRRRFAVRLHQISRHIAGERWAELADLIAPWGAAVGGADALGRLRSGHPVFRTDPVGALKSSLRKMVGRLLD